MRNILSALAIVMLVCIMGTPAHATLQVQINGTNNGSIVTGGSLFTDGIADATADGNLSFTYAGIATFNISVVNGSSFTPSAILSMTLNGGALTSPTVDFTIAVSDNGYTIPSPPLYLDQDIGGTSFLSGGVTGSLTAQGFFGSNTTAFDTSGVATGVASATINAGTTMSTSTTILTGSPYSLTTFITVHLVKGTASNENAQINANLNAIQVPEPAGVVLLGGVLILTMSSLRRRFRRV
jgi:hypothetical protein